MEALTRRAVALDSGDAEARSWLGSALQLSGDSVGAMAEIERAVAMSPNLASAQGALARTLIYSGYSKEGLVAVQRYLRLDPYGPMVATNLLQVAVGHYFCREYGIAIEAALRSIRSYPGYPNPYRWLAAARGQAGQIEEARTALEKG
jgi:adenylate cyclase